LDGKAILNVASRLVVLLIVVLLVILGGVFGVGRTEAAV